MEAAEIDVFKPLTEQAPAEVAAAPVVEKTEEKPSAENPLPEVKEIEVQKEEERLSPKFLAAAKKEREIFERDRSLKTREKELEARLKNFEEAERLKKEDPLKYLEKSGIDYNDLTKQILEGKVPETHAIKQLRTELEGLRKEREEEKEKAEAARKEAAVQKFKNDMTQHIRGNAEKYPLVGALNGEETVYNVIEQHFNSTGEVMPYDQASELTESYYTKQIKEALKNPALKNMIVAELGITETKQNSPEKKAAPNNPVTLTNLHSQDIPTREPRTLTDEERLNEAAKHLRWGE